VTQSATRELAEALGPQYRAATSRAEKKEILDHYCRSTGCHRKAAIRRLRRSARAPAGRRGRPRQYGADLVPTLAQLWEFSDRACGKLLAPVIPLLLAALERHGALNLAPALRKQLEQLSPATVDRLLRPVRARRGRQPRRQPLAASTLRADIPLRTWSEWRDVRPGAVQGDLVLHCGESTAGFYLTTLVTIDVATAWTELEAVWGLGQQRVSTAVHQVRARLPVPLCEWHNDNGSEFVNRLLVPALRRAGIRVTRGRGYRKNDQAWVEQRNWLALRRIVGYDRYTSRAAFARLQHLYRLLRHLNFVRPVRKLVSKERIGAKIIKRYDRAQTPYQRLLAAGVLSPDRQHALEQELLAINPAALWPEIGRTLDGLWKLAQPSRCPSGG
jgi:hypothetical protein